MPETSMEKSAPWVSKSATSELKIKAPESMIRQFS